MENDDNLQFDELYAITRSNSPLSENRSTSAMSDSETSNIPTIKKTKLGQKGGSKKRSWVWKYFQEKKIIETIQTLDQKINVEVVYGICQVLNDANNKTCDAKLKVSNSSTSNLISHLVSTHGITQAGPL